MLHNIAHYGTLEPSLADLHNEGKLLIEEGFEAIRRLAGDLPGRKTSTGEYLSAEETRQARYHHAEAEESRKRQRKAASRGAQPHVPEPAAEEKESQPVVSGLEEVMRQLEEQRRLSEEAQ